MTALPYWINGSLAIVPRPRGGDWLDDEMRVIQEAGIDVVVSMLEPAEARELGLEREHEAAVGAGVGFVGFPIRDRSVPQVSEFLGFLSRLESILAEGKRIGIHCRACIGRSSVVAASLLIRAGAPAEEAWAKIEAARGFPVPDTAEQLEWVGRHMRPRA